ncbi:PREDICTED: melanoma-associated antigen 8-like [Chinchilla lanigera]|uniref:melanoma-associated antigen 8-like n=1 Tax=Chinchilla lanigera TaxID=34839 RepID=UPI0006971B30|nr:PREDICTED: melanoma-associated antigen 8-like [Chinchilla lanigera]
MSYDQESGKNLSTCLEHIRSQVFLGHHVDRSRSKAYPNALLLLTLFPLNINLLQGNDGEICLWLRFERSGQREAAFRGVRFRDITRWCTGSLGQQRSRSWSADGGGQNLPAVKVLESPSPSTCLRSHTTAIMSGSPKPYQLEEDREDQSTIEEVSAAGMLDPSQCPERGSSPSNTMVATPLSQTHGGSSSEQEQGLFSLPALLDTDSLLSDVLGGKVAKLMEFLAIKYLIKEPTTMEEMQMVVTRDYEEHFPVIFGEASKYMQLVFGIDIEEVGPTSPFYVLTPSLGLTYDGIVSDEQSHPRTIVLIFILGAIHLQGNRASEEAIWEVLSGVGLYPGKEHCIYGEPRKFLTKDLVQEQYLVCVEVPDSDPPQYEFLWGPRAHAETSVEKVLEFLDKFKDSNLKALPSCH